MYEIITGKRAWKNLSSQKIILSLNSKVSPFDDNWEKKVQADITSVIKKCCKYDENKRITSEECFESINKII